MIFLHSVKTLEASEHSSDKGYKVPKCKLKMAPMLGMAMMAFGINSVFGYLDPQGNRSLEPQRVLQIMGLIAPPCLRYLMALMGPNNPLTAIDSPQAGGERRLEGSPYQGPPINPSALQCPLPRPPMDLY